MAGTVVSSTIINPTHHGARATIAAAYGVTAALMFLVTRLVVRWPLTSLFRWDDAAITFATFLAAIQVSLVVVAVKHGLGTTPSLLDAEDITLVEKLIYASNVVYVLVSYMSRLSVVLFFNRLSTQKQFARTILGLMGACAVFGIVSVIVAAVQMPYARPWQSTKTSPNDESLTHWIVVEVLLALLDIGCTVMPILLVRGLQMKRSRKAEVVGAFALRMVSLVFAGLRLSALSRALQHPSNFPEDYVGPEIYTQVAMTFGLVSATIPSLRIFFNATRTGMLDGGIWTDMTESQKATAGGGSFASWNRTKRGQRSENGVELSTFRSEQNVTRVKGGYDGQSLDSGNSQRAIVVKSTFEVVGDPIENEAPR